MGGTNRVLGEDWGETTARAKQVTGMVGDTEEHVLGSEPRSLSSKLVLIYSRVYTL